jgi:hypothetical protein
MDESGDDGVGDVIGLVGIGGAAGASTAAAAHPKKVDEATPDQTWASIHDGDDRRADIAVSVQCDPRHIFFLSV